MPILNDLYAVGATANLGSGHHHHLACTRSHVEEQAIFIDPTWQESEQSPIFLVVVHQHDFQDVVE
jgi:hypothetical protein